MVGPHHGRPPPLEDTQDRAHGIASGIRFLSHTELHPITRGRSLGKTGGNKNREILGLGRAHLQASAQRSDHPAGKHPGPGNDHIGALDTENQPPILQIPQLLFEQRFLALQKPQAPDQGAEAQAFGVLP